MGEGIASRVREEKREKDKKGKERGKDSLKPT